MAQTVSNNKNAFSEDFSAAVLELAANAQHYSDDVCDAVHQNADGKKILISIRNLKQYFPVKGHRDMFVKANDGINIDIYEGETFGLVGESGCGKSTLGRTSLQLYQQTEGRTLYYGRPLDAPPPKYLHNSIKELPGRKHILMKLHTTNRKAAEDMFLDLVHIFGGLFLSPNENEVMAAYTERYKTSDGITEEETKKKTETFEALRRSIAESSMADMENFKKLEKLRDNGINLACLTYNEMRHLRRDMQIIFQDPYSSLNPRMTVGQIIGEGSLAHGFFQDENETRSALHAHVVNVMINCGLAPYMIHRYPHQF